MNVLNVQNLRKSIGARTLYDGVSFAIDENEKLGLIGANGSGKSTLLRVLAGEDGHDEGGILALQRGARVGYLAQEPTFRAGQTTSGAAAEGNPEIYDALVAYHEVTARLAELAHAPAADTSAPAAIPVAASATSASALSTTNSPAQGDEGAHTPTLDRLLTRQADLAARLDLLGGWDWESTVEAMLTRLGVTDWDRTVDDLSGGERKRVALARTLLARPELLLLDEPTNHLDADTVLWLEEHLAEYPGAVLLITHDRYFLDRVVDRMIEIAAGTLTSYPGGYTNYLEAKAERMAQLEAAEGKRLKLIEKELEWARRAPPARTGKSRARLQQIDALEGEQRRYKKTVRTREVTLEAAPPPRLGRTVLELSEIEKSYDERALIRDFTASLRAGQRVGIIGPNGAGKTTLLRILLGEESADAGEVEIGINTKIAYFDQRRSDLDDNASVYEAAAGTDWVTVGGRRVHLRSYLEEFLFPTAVQEQRVRSLSGGERNRLLLAKLLLQESNLLILDEPTNDLDLVTLQTLEAMLEDYPGCVLVVTHDRFFLDKVATDLWVFEGDGVVREHAGGYDLYRRLRDEREAAEATARREEEEAEARRRERQRAQERGKTTSSGTPSSPGHTSSPTENARPKKLTWKEQRELEGIEAEILAAETARDELEARLADPAFYGAGGGDVAETNAAYQEAVARVEALYARWAELEERVG
jgi:ATP-binding cassette subfamily F protein uup